MSSSVDLPPEAHELKRGSLTTVDAVAMAVAFLSPAMAMAYNTSFAAGAAGGSTPLAFLLGGVACLTLAFVVIGFTRRLASAGYAYTYVSRVFGKSAGFMTGWLYTFGIVCFVPMTMAGVGGFTSDLLSSQWGIHISWFIIFLVGMALLVALAVYDIKVNTRTQLVVGILTVAVILVVDAIVFAKGGVHGQTLEPFTFGHTVRGGFDGVFYGIIFGVLSYIGFETSAVLGEETRNPRKAIPLSILIAVGFGIVFYVLTTYVIAIGIGVNNGAAWAKDPTVLQTLADDFTSGHVLSVLIAIAAILSAFIVCTAAVTAATRAMFAMGREGALPRWLGHTHPRYNTPAKATLFVAAIATVIAAFVGFAFDYGQGPFTVFGLMAGIGGVAVILVYIGLCVAGVVWFRAVESRRSVLRHTLVPVLGAIIFALAIYGSVWPVPPMPFRVIPYVNLAWILAGLAILAYLKRNVPDRIARIGEILGEEGGEEGAVLDAPALSRT